MHRAGALFPFATPIPGAMPACHRYWKRCLINEFKKRPQCWGPLVLVNRSVAVGEAARAAVQSSSWSSGEPRSCSQYNHLGLQLEVHPTPSSDLLPIYTSHTHTHTHTETEKQQKKRGGWRRTAFQMGMVCAKNWSRERRGQGLSFLEVVTAVHDLASPLLGGKAVQTTRAGSGPRSSATGQAGPSWGAEGFGSEESRCHLGLPWRCQPGAPGFLKMHAVVF